MFCTIAYKGHFIHIKQFEGKPVIQVQMVLGNITQRVIECNTLLGAKRLITNLATDLFP